MSRFVGKRPIQGMTNNNLSNIQDISCMWVNSSGTNINATAFALLSEGTLRHEAETKVLKDNKGNRCAVFATEEVLTLDVVAVPAGANLSESLTMATVPEALSFVTITNAPNIPFGPYNSDAINGTNWLYTGGAELVASNENEWGLRFTVTRSANLAKSNAVTT